MNLNGQALGENSEISLLTASPGKELYSTFGHTAIRVLDPDLKIDRVYGYGTFDFSTPFFYLKFARGDLNYRLDTEPFYRTQSRYGFIDVYTYLERGVHEQKLNLSLQQRQQIFDYLLINHLPQNQYYRYDYLFDNCATRPRDVIYEALGNELVLDTTFVEEGLTFRQLIDRYVEDTPWIDFGIDLLLGAVIDREMTAQESMFIPDYLEKALDHTKVNMEEQTLPLVQSNSVVLRQKASPGTGASLPGPTITMWILFLAIAAITGLGFQRKIWKHQIDGGMYILYGLVGCLLAVLWFGTLHSSTAQNWNLLWAFPFHLVVGIFLFRAKRPEWLNIYLIGLIGIGLCMLLFWGIIPQELHPANIPLILILTLRSSYTYYSLRKIS